MASPSNVIEMENITSQEVKHQAVLNVETLVNELPPISPNRCIYKVPARIRQLNEKLYTPQAVSIGPFHHGRNELKAMEVHKLSYLKAFLVSTRLKLDDLMNTIQGWETRIRECYAETFHLTQSQFLEMLLIDSCFVLEAIMSLFDLTYEQSIYVSRIVLQYEVDMILLENQLPFFLLNGLYRLAFPDSSAREFTERCILFFQILTLTKVDGSKLVEKVTAYLESGHQVLHFVDLLRICHLPTTLRAEPSHNFTLIAIPKVTQLQDAGIRLKSGSSCSPLDIEYKNGMIEIPRITIDETSAYLLSNILVLETCHYFRDSYVRDYVFFMDMLVDTPKDVDSLIQEDIIQSWSSDSYSVAELFNNVGYDIPIIIEHYYFYNVSQELNSYCSVPRHKWMATFKREYWSTPWRIASTSAAVILLLLTFISTICSVIQL